MVFPIRKMLKQKNQGIVCSYEWVAQGVNQLCRPDSWLRGRSSRTPPDFCWSGHRGCSIGGCEKCLQLSKIDRPPCATWSCCARPSLQSWGTPIVGQQNYSSTTKQSCQRTTQGDPLAMAFYALAIPLARRCKVDLKGESWFADDAAGGAHPRRLRQWWDNLVSLGPSYGYFVNGQKTWLIVKEAHLEAGRAAFNGTEVQITTVGQRHLGAPLGSSNFVEQYVQAKVAKWVDQLDRLSVIAQSDPQAAYSAFVHGFQNSWIYLARCVPGIGDLLKPLEEVLEKCFIPALTSHNPKWSNKRSSSPSSKTRRFRAGKPCKGGGEWISRLVCAICEDYGCTANATWRSERPRSNAPAKGSFAPTEARRTGCFCAGCLKQTLTGVATLCHHCLWERCIELAHSLTTPGPWFLAVQGNIPGRHSTPIWLVPPQSAFRVCLWETVLSRPRPKL